jgi:transketolase
MTPSARPVAVADDTATLVSRLEAAAAETRARSLIMTHHAGLGHPGADLSSADILVTLYHGVLRVDPTTPDDPDRDRFVMSKGHGSASYYATLAQTGFFSEALLDEFMAPLSPLSGHPRNGSLPGIEASTGPLGHGLPLAVGMAIAGKLDRSQRLVYCLVGDGELQEGSNWEALMTAGHRGLDNLIVIVDRNRLQQGAETEETNRLEPLADKARAFRLAVAEVDGHDHLALLVCLRNIPLAAAKPTFIIAHTHKGNGVSFIRDRIEWHHRVPTEDELNRALEELGFEAG